MGKVHLKVRSIRYSICALFILLLFLPIIYGFNIQNNNANDRAIIIFESNMTISYDIEDTEKTITPIEDTLKIDILIDYGIKPVNRLLHNLIFLQYAWKKVEIDVEIDDSSLPNYVSASVTPNKISANISQELTRAIGSLALFVKVDENAPAFKDIPIKIKASAPEIFGLLGFTKIDNATASVEVIVQPSYAGLIAYNLPGGNSFNISPNSKTLIPIEITNLGNGPTNVTFDVINHPKGWNVHINESEILERYEKSTIYLAVKTDERFNKRGTVLLRMNSSYSLDPTLSGLTYTLSFTLTTNKEEENKNAIGVEIFVLIFVIIILVIVTIYILYWKKLK
jgi:hypothetical protein